MHEFDLHGDAAAVRDAGAASLLPAPGRSKEAGMTADDAKSSLARISAQHDLYLQLLELGQCDDIESFLEQAVRLVVRVTEARRGYLELYGDSDDQPGWWTAHDLKEPDIVKVRSMISRGIVAETLARGETLVTASALLDPRFRDRESVMINEIEAVLCAPIGADGSYGVLYLEGRSEPGMFSPRDRHAAELFVRHIAPVARRFVAEQSRSPDAGWMRDLRASLHLKGLVGQSSALAATLRHVALVAPLDVTVLLTGESGTGKSLLARVIHDNGPRASGPFVELNCGALPDTLIESELFGAMPGAHSTASRRIEGKVAAAENGTLFLDEVALLSATAQPKLLQLLQSKEYYPLGSATPVRANVRLIAATNVDLQQAVADRQFREDLYYRLHVLPVRVPSLAERRSDIPELAKHLAGDACRRNGLPVLPLSRNARRALEAATWPGNIRQLANVLEAAVIRAVADGAEQIEGRHLFPDDPPPAEIGDEHLSLQEATRRFQHDFVERVLEETDWNVVEAARRLDVARSRLYTLIRAFGFKRHR